MRAVSGRYGNPYGFVGVDGNGRATIEWGVYGRTGDLHRRATKSSTR
jgi:hypothetical protein